MRRPEGVLTKHSRQGEWRVETLSGQQWCLRGCRATPAEGGRPRGSGDSTCACGVCNHCSQSHTDHFQDNLQRASCFLLGAGLRVRARLRPGTVPAVQVEKASLWVRHQVPCPVIGSSSAVPGAWGRVGVARLPGASCISGSSPWYGLTAPS